MLLRLITSFGAILAATATAVSADEISFKHQIRPILSDKCFQCHGPDAGQRQSGLRLDDEYDIMSRVGLHCAPAAHKTLGTFPAGTVRFGLSAFNTLDQVDRATQAVRGIAGSS